MTEKTNFLWLSKARAGYGDTPRLNAIYIEKGLALATDGFRIHSDTAEHSEGCIAVVDNFDDITHSMSTPPNVRDRYYEAVHGGDIGSTLVSIQYLRDALGEAMTETDKVRLRLVHNDNQLGRVLVIEHDDGRKAVIMPIHSGHD